MVSNMLNLHPRVLSLSEFFSFVGTGAMRRRTTTGEQMWGWYAHQRKRTRLMLRGEYQELAYPFGNPGARYGRDDVPPILCGALPHLTPAHDALFDEVGPVVRSWPRQAPALHFRALFEWLCQRLERDVWVERSGASLLFGTRLLRAFPDARVVHVHRDGRETAMSMSRHYLFRMILATMHALRARGIDAMSSMSQGRFWEWISLWLEPLATRWFDPVKLPYDNLTLVDFGVFWSGMIERGHQLLADLPPDRLLNIAFEDLRATPEPHLRRLIRFVSPELEDDGWLREASRIPRSPRSPTAFEQLDAADQQALAQACRPGLERLGYSL